MEAKKISFSDKNALDQSKMYNHSIYQLGYFIITTSLKNDLVFSIIVLFYIFPSFTIMTRLSIIYMFLSLMTSNQPNNEIKNVDTCFNDAYNNPSPLPTIVISDVVNSYQIPYSTWYIKTNDEFCIINIH